MSEDHRRLENLTQMLLDTELARLKALADEARGHEDAMAEISAALQSRAQALAEQPAGDDLAFCTGQDARWQSWSTEQRKRCALAAAEAAARREAQRQVAQRAFGRVQALAALRQQAEDARKLKAARKSWSDPDLS